MGDAEWNCAEVPDWKKELCCPYCHASNERSFTFLIREHVKRLCCKYSLPYIQMHKAEEIIIMDTDLLLTPVP